MQIATFATSVIAKVGLPFKFYFEALQKFLHGIMSLEFIAD